MLSITRKVTTMLRLFTKVQTTSRLNIHRSLRACSSEAAVPEQTFASLFRSCKLTQMGDPVDKVVVGRVYHVVDDDLYIDFGHKFPSICQRPRDSRGKFVRGSEVLVRIKSLELSQRFLGYDKDLTLLEADTQLVGFN